MSASEKLKMLTDRAQRADDQSLSRERRRQLKLQSCRTALAVLPLITDVVKAAEFSREREWAYPGELEDALAVLEQALTNPQGKD